MPVFLKSKKPSPFGSLSKKPNTAQVGKLALPSTPKSPKLGFSSKVRGMTDDLRRS